MPKSNTISSKHRDSLLKTLEARFDANPKRHAGLSWSTVQARLKSNAAALSSLHAMEESGGEPDEEYQHLQTLGEFDTTTSSWVQTPPKIRKLGGAVFCDRRYDTVFLYHNGAESYYAARGFRCVLRV